MTSLRNQLEWCTKAQAILGLVLSLILVGFYVFGYRPFSTRLADLQLEIDHSSSELLKNTSQVRILPAVMVAVNDLKSRLEKYDKQLPRQQELDRFIKDINTMVHNAQLQKLSYTPSVMPIRSELFAEQPVSFKFEGDFLKVFSFLRQTEQMQRLTRVRELKIKNSNRSSKAGQVEVELSMNIYFSEG
ncbi:MAG TPA: type 4a pilus biogenesis protein PilO [Tepidisphaeraceae bacterium]